ncbi:TIGR04084 family radical SAM/SPASM domain-containing protein [Candidatus Bathyarchaeota archaeon]|nr:TIGR04084 family radical SAM/SPASM domain-containing protein [Candidatus Bathyarchaeota archaeon]
MIYNIILTHDCNKNCTYCLNQESEVPFPRQVAYSLDDLKRFTAMDDHPVLAFYGGEPLLAMDLMERMMDEVPAEKYIIQTNGHFLNRLEDEYLFQFDCMLVSIDGRKEITDFYRGEGTHDRVIGNVENLRKRGFKAEITARMCASQRTDIHEDVSYLLGLRDGRDAPLFSGVHWQNDMQFGAREDWDDLDGWLRESYYPGIEFLVEDWISDMELQGDVRLVYPFTGIMGTLLTGTPAKLRCGCGHFNHNICTDGRITACPVSSDFYPRFLIGDIRSTHPRELVNALECGEPCTSCTIRDICGGRCLYANLLKPWGEAGFSNTCETVQHLVNTLKRQQPRVRSLLETGRISMAQFEYFKYNGAEIIP